MMSSAPTPTLTGKVCGTCRHGQPDGLLIACTLGWEFHDPRQAKVYNTRTRKADLDAILPHPGVPVPLLAPQTHCMALHNNWLPKKAG